ncbi:MAG TPA: DUF4153 domain-containing protein [Candidatus Saccharimonadales bacterium]|nr:DUF4153 domain-containing protein [Candidatus Saccharimonadales bacterium]
MPRTTARRLALAALALGIVADLLFDGPALGLNVPIFVAAILGVAWVLRRRGRAPDPLDAWLPVSALVLAGFVAVRADPIVGGLDLLAALVCTGAAVAAFSGLAVTRRSASAVVATGAWVLEAGLAGAGRILAAARPERRHGSRRLPEWAGAVGRGLLLGIPLVLIFAVLFASADPIFRRGLDDVLGLRIDLGDLPGRVLFILASAWFVGGLLSVAATGIPALERSSLGAAARSATIRADRVLGTTEAIVVLIAVDLVVALFVGLQLAYLFGGLDTLAAAGMSYASYARRGYFELVGAACLAGGILVGLDLNIARRSRAYLALAIGLVGLTALVLASAALRLQLYQDAYGWTELRLYVAVSIVALAVTLAALALGLALDRTRWLGHAMAGIAVVSLLALNVLAPASFVAQRNVDRIIHPELVPADGQAGLDAEYLAVLPDDAVPILVAALPQLPEPDATRIRAMLVDRRGELAAPADGLGILSWNLGRERARAALGAMP